MPVSAKRKQHLNVRDTEQNGPAFTEDFDGKLADAQTQLEMLQAQRHEIERQKVALEDLNQRKQEFLNGQLDLSERFSSAITTIERELYLSKQEIDDLDQTRKAFANHLQRIDNLNPENWPKESVRTELEKALLCLDKAEDEYEQAVAYFAGSRKSSVFGGTASESRLGNADSDFQTMLRNGLAFNLPLLILGTLALLVYLIK